MDVIMIPAIKFYGSDIALAHQIMVSAITIMHNAGQSPAETMLLVYETLATGIDVNDADREAVLGIMRDIIERHSQKTLSTVI